MTLMPVVPIINGVFNDEVVFIDPSEIIYTKTDYHKTYKSIVIYVTAKGEYIPPLIAHHHIQVAKYYNPNLIKVHRTNMINTEKILGWKDKELAIPLLDGIDDIITVAMNKVKEIDFALKK